MLSKKEAFQDYMCSTVGIEPSEEIAFDRGWEAANDWMKVHNTLVAKVTFNNCFNPEQIISFFRQSTVLSSSFGITYNSQTRIYELTTTNPNDLYRAGMVASAIEKSASELKSKNQANG